MHITRPVLFLTVLCFIVIPLFVGAQSVPEEARRHMARGQTAVEMAKSPDDYGPAIKEFQAAARLAPGWPDPWYNLALLQEKTGKLKEAIASLKEYLRLAPNAPNAAKIREQIYKLEYKAEQVLTVPQIIDALVSLLQWDCDKDISKYPRLYMWGELRLQRAGTETVKALRLLQYYRNGEYYQTLKVTGPILKYTTTVNVCDESANRQAGGCDSVVENEIEVVSKTLVRVNQRVLRGGDGAGVRTGQNFSFTFRKK